MKPILKAALLILLALNFVSPAEARKLNDYEKKKVAIAQKYFDDLKTLKASFIQLEAANSSLVRGEIFISRPGKMLMRYRDPTEADFYIVAGRVLMYDYELEQLNHTDSENTPFDIFLKKDFKLDGNLMLVIDSVTEGANTFKINMSPLSDEDQETKAVALEFSLQTNQLVSFERTATDDNRFIITLVNPQLNTPLDSNIFVFKDPRKSKFPTSR